MPLRQSLRTDWQIFTLNATYAVGSAVVKSSAQGDLQEMHVETHRPTTDWRFHDPWVQGGITRDEALAAPARAFLFHGYMDPWGGNPSWNGHMDVARQDWFFLDFRSMFSEQVKLVWSWREE